MVRRSGFSPISCCYFYCCCCRTEARLICCCWVGCDLYVDCLLLVFYCMIFLFFDFLSWKWKIRYIKLELLFFDVYGNLLYDCVRRIKLCLLLFLLFVLKFELVLICIWCLNVLLNFRDVLWLILWCLLCRMLCSVLLSRLKLFDWFCLIRNVLCKFCCCCCNCYWFWNVFLFVVVSFCVLNELCVVLVCIVWCDVWLCCFL